MLGVWRFEGGLFGLFGRHSCLRGGVGGGSVHGGEGEVEVRVECEDGKIYSVLPLLQNVFNASMYLTQRCNREAIGPRLYRVNLYCSIVRNRRSPSQCHRHGVEAIGGTITCTSFKITNSDNRFLTTQPLAEIILILISNYLIPQSSLNAHSVPATQQHAKLHCKATILLRCPLIEKQPIEKQASKQASELFVAQTMP